MTTPPRQETIYVSRRVKRGLLTLATLEAAKAGADLPNLDALADSILTDYLTAIPDLEAREKEIRDAVKGIDAKYAERAKPNV